MPLLSVKHGAHVKGAEAGRISVCLARFEGGNPTAISYGSKSLYRPVARSASANRDEAS